MNKKFKTFGESWADMIYMHVDATKFFQDWKSPEEIQALEDENELLKKEKLVLEDLLRRYKDELEERYAQIRDLENENEKLKHETTKMSTMLEKASEMENELLSLKSQHEKPVIPKFVANLVERVIRYNICPSDMISGFYYNNESKIPENINHDDFEVEEISDWLSYAFRRIDFEKACFIGYEVEKEKLFYLKHIEFSKQHELYNYFLARGKNGELRHDLYMKEEKILNGNQDYLKFTQSEIDKLAVGSYEQIPVEEDTEDD